MVTVLDSRVGLHLLLIAVRAGGLLGVLPGAAAVGEPYWKA